MPSGPNVAAALAQIYGIAQNNGVSVENFTIAPPSIQLPQTGQEQAYAAGETSFSLGQVTKPLGTLSFQFKASGNYESFKNFLSQIETNIRIFDIKDFDLQPIADTNSPGTGTPADLFTYNVSVVTYYQLP